MCRIEAEVGILSLPISIGGVLEAALREFPAEGRSLRYRGVWMNMSLVRLKGSLPSLMSA